MIHALHLDHRPRRSSRARAATWTCLAATVLAAASCGGSGNEQAAPTTGPQTQAAPTGPVDGPPMTGVSNRGMFQVEVTPKGGPVPTNEPFDVRVSVSEPESGAPFTAFDSITLDARMPAHDHGMNFDVELVATDQPGEYVAEGLLFHMIGYWEFHVDVVQGPKIERAQVATQLDF